MGFAALYPSYALMALLLVGCGSTRNYALKNSEGKVLECIAPASSIFSAGQSNDPRPFQACIDACRPHGYEPVAPIPPGLEPESDAEKTQYIPTECR